MFGKYWFFHCTGAAGEILISVLITRLIIINTAPWTKLFCNCRLFCNCPLADLHLPAVKRYQFQYKVFVGSVWLTSNHMFGSGIYWDKWPSWFLKIFKNAIGQFIPNRPPKHVAPSTHSMVALIPYCYKQWGRQKIKNFVILVHNPAASSFSATINCENIFMGRNKFLVNYSDNCKKNLKMY